MPPSKRRKTTGSTMACALREKAPARVKIDANGDLCLKVGHNECLKPDDSPEDHDHQYAVIYVVDSNALSRSSSVWRKMLNGAFAESIRPDPNSGKEWMVELPDDDPTSTLIIMDIIHSRFNRVPRKMSMESLYQLTVLTDKYDLTPLIYPWAENWSALLRTHPKCLIAGEYARKLRTLEMFFWISWELGNQQLFHEVYTHLVLNTRLETDYLVEGDSGARLFSDEILEPCNISDYIRASRQGTITAILNIFKSSIDECLGDGRVGTHDPYCSSRDDCELLMLGRLMKWLKNNRLWPIPDANTISMTIKELVVRAKTCHILGSGVNGCRFKNLEAHLKGITDAIQTPSKVITHLRSQAKKTGLTA